MDSRSEDSPRASFSRWNTINSDFTPCQHDFGIYGQRKNCLYATVIIITAMVIMNMAILVWIIRVMDFTIDGMGKLRITKKGIRVEGEAEFMSSVHASRIRTEQDMPLTIQSSSNITMAVHDNRNKLANSIFIGDSYIEAKCDKFAITDNKDHVLFQVSEDDILFDVHTLKFPGDNNQGGLVFDGSMQTNLLHSGLFSSLRLESLTRSLKIEGAEGVFLESRAGQISASCLGNLQLISNDGVISLNSKKVEFKNLPISTPNERSKVDEANNIQETYQLCSCQNGKLFLSSPSGNCQADHIICK